MPCVRMLNTRWRYDSISLGEKGTLWINRICWKGQQAQMSITEKKESAELLRVLAARNWHSLSVLSTFLNRRTREVAPLGYTLGRARSDEREKAHTLTWLAILALACRIVLKVRSSYSRLLNCGIRYSRPSRPSPLVDASSSLHPRPQNFRMSIDRPPLRWAGDESEKSVACKG